MHAEDIVGAVVFSAMNEWMNEYVNLYSAQLEKT